MSYSPYVLQLVFLVLAVALHRFALTSERDISVDIYLPRMTNMVFVTSGNLARNPSHQIIYLLCLAKNLETVVCRRPLRSRCVDNASLSNG